jgi:uncharacterized protein YpuA (DUF1002 family)
MDESLGSLIDEELYKLTKLLYNSKDNRDYAVILNYLEEVEKELEEIAKDIKDFREHHGGL